MIPRTLFVIVLALSLPIGPAFAQSPPAPTPPDPAKTPLKRGTFHVEIEETVEGEVSEQSYCKALVTRMLVLHGFRRVKASRARYRIRGTANYEFVKRHDFEFKDSRVLLEYQFEGSVLCTIEDRKPPANADGTPGTPTTVEVSLPKVLNGRQDRAQAARDIRRLVGTSFARQLVNTAPLARPEVVALLGELRSGGGRRVPELFSELVALGYASAPYLLDAMLEEEEVKAKGTIRGEDADDLTLHVLADHALARILDCKRGLSGDSNRVDAQRYWNRAWEDAQKVPEKYRLPRRPEER